MDEVLGRRVAAALFPLGEVLDAYVFGSEARRRTHPMSDVDVAVFIDPSAPEPPPWGHAAHITTVLISALARNDIDVSILNGAAPLLYHRVLRDGVAVLSRDPVETAGRALAARSRWLDWVAFRARAA